MFKECQISIYVPRFESNGPENPKGEEENACRSRETS